MLLWMTKWHHYCFSRLCSKTGLKLWIGTNKLGKILWYLIISKDLESCIIYYIQDKIGFVNDCCLPFAPILMTVLNIDHAGVWVLVCFCYMGDGSKFPEVDKYKDWILKLCCLSDKKKTYCWLLFNTGIFGKSGLMNFVVLIIGHLLICEMKVGIRWANL